MLTIEQMTRIVAQLRSNADAADAAIAAASSSFFTRMISYDNGGPERFAIVQVRKTADVLERTAQRDFDAGDTDNWLATEQAAEKTLDDVKGYRAQTTAAQIIKDTASATASDVKDVAATGLSLVPWQVWAGLGAVVGLVVLFQLGGLRARA